MLKKICLSLLMGSAFLSTNLFAATEHYFNLSPAYEFILPSNEPQVYTNAFFFSINATCTIVSKTPNIPFSFKVLKYTGTLNGVPLSENDTLDLVVHPGDKLHITAVSRAKVELVNHSDESITANCVSN